MTLATKTPRSFIFRPLNLLRASPRQDNYASQIFRARSYCVSLMKDIQARWLSAARRVYSRVSALEAGVGNDPCTLAWDLPDSPLGCCCGGSREDVDLLGYMRPVVLTRPDAAFGSSNDMLAAYAKPMKKEGKSRRGNSDAFRQVGSPKDHSVCVGAPSEGKPRDIYTIVSLR
jgi:hypothetical protein